MSNDRDDALHRQETTPFGRQDDDDPDRWRSPAVDGPSGAGATAAGRSPAPQPGEPPRYGPPDQYGQAPYGPGPYGAAPYGQPSYGQTPYGQGTYGQASYGQAPYGQTPYGPGHYGGPAYGQDPYGGSPYPQPAYGAAQPARPGTVITAAVLGLVHGALGLLVTVAFLAGGAIIDDLVDALETSDPTIDAGATTAGIDDARAGLIVLALLALAWTVVMVWGSVLALSGRSRVLLIVGSSIAVAATGLFFLFGLVSIAAADAGQDGQAGGIVFLLVLFLAALAMLVLLCLRPSAQFFAAHRQRRALAVR